MKDLVLLTNCKRGSDTKKITEIEKIYLKAILGKIELKEIKIADNASSYLNYKKHRRFKFLIIGKIPIWLDKKNEQIERLIHIVVDKYLCQSSYLGIKFDRNKINTLIEILYSNITPNVIIVNNKEMVVDFNKAMKLLNINCKILCMPHPVTNENLDNYNKSLINKWNNINNKYLLSDSGFVVKPKCNILNKIIKSYPYNLFKTEIILGLQSTSFVGLYNFRPFSKDLKLKNEKMYLIKNLYMVIFELYSWRIKLELKSIFNYFYYRKKYCDNLTMSLEQLNAKWKPSTKLSTSVSYRLPLLTKYEESIFYYSKKFNILVYFYENNSEISSYYKLFVTNNDEIQQRMIKYHDKWLNSINDDCYQVFSESLTFLNAKQ